MTVSVPEIGTHPENASEEGNEAMRRAQGGAERPERAVGPMARVDLYVRTQLELGRKAKEERKIRKAEVEAAALAKAATRVKFEAEVHLMEEAKTAAEDKTDGQVEGMTLTEEGPGKVKQVS